MSERNFLIPCYGPLAGMRVLGSGSLIAMPTAITLLADFGAEVIQIERPGNGDTYRVFPPVAKTDRGISGSSWVQDARNRLSMTLELDLKDPDIKDIFFRLIRESDVYIENMVWLEKLGIKDQDLLHANPRLVIVHISGFGHQEFGGVPEICEQASYDMIGQAFSGFVLYNGYPDRPPLVVKPSLNDYFTAMFAVFGVLMAYMYAKDTGRGQVVDVAQFEAQARLMRDAFTIHDMGLGEVQRVGSRAVGFQPWDLFVSKDGKYVAIGSVGPAVFNRFLDAVGFDKDRYSYEKVSIDRKAVESPAGQEFAAKIRSWCAEHSAEEIESAMRRCRVPCSAVNDAEACMSHPHFIQREDFVSCEDQTTGLNVTTFGIVPKFSETPGKIWRGAPALGQDTDRILKELLGYSEEQVTSFREKGII